MDGKLANEGIVREDLRKLSRLQVHFNVSVYDELDISWWTLSNERQVAASHISLHNDGWHLEKLTHETHLCELSLSI